MNRTRLTFYVVLAVCLAILALSLSSQVLSEARLLQMFVAASVFAGGVVALDFLGLLGHHGDFAGHDLGGHGAADAGGLSGGHDVGAHDIGSHDLGGHDVGGAQDMGGHAVDVHAASPANGHAGDAASGHLDHAAQPAAHGEATATHPEQGQSHAGHVLTPGRNGQPAASAAPVLSVLVYLRLLVYFCLGFGPAGWVALANGWGAWRALLLAVPVGLASLTLARAFFRFQRHDTGAVPTSAGLLNERATVIVPLDGQAMGKVRVTSGMTVSELYALPAEAEHAYEVGETVSIVRVEDDCVYVR